MEVITEWEPGTLRIKIADTGAGIDPEVIKEIFDPFFSIQGHGGTGLGLYMCRAILKEIRGTIDVESAPGEGATFVVELPEIL